MDSTRHIIRRHKKNWPDFEYYLGIIDKAEKNLEIHPDISIEASKALIEGVCQSILRRLDNTFSSKWAKDVSLGQLFSRTKNVLAEMDLGLEEQFLEAANQLVHQIGNLYAEIGRIRNARGDISHGKEVPKEEVSAPHFARMIFHVAEGISFYLLHVFYSVDLSYKEFPRYEDFNEFNDWLDEENPLDNVSFSRALYDQRPEDYRIRLSYYSDAEEMSEGLEE